MVSAINNAFMKLTKRADKVDRSKLVATFVDVGPLFTLLYVVDNQVLYGRRGTGKTHALSYLADATRKAGDISVYIDTRNIGSTGGMYSDGSPLAQRATALLLDALTAIHDGLYEYFVEMAEELDLSKTGPLLDRLASEITNVYVAGTIQREEKHTDTRDSNLSQKSDLTVGSKEIKLTLTDSSEQKQKKQTEAHLSETGVTQHRVHFGAIGQIFREIAQFLGKKRIWILIDEWSSLPIELQPYLADLLRRTIFPIQNITVKIAAIEQRSRFRIIKEHGEYLGMELGADISADLNLDDFMVFNNDADRAKSFFKELLYKHVKEAEGTDDLAEFSSADELIHHGFTQQNTFEELVRATEGVPRDAIYIISLAAQKALGDRLAMEHINIAARQWYQRDKEAALKPYTEAHALLHWIIEEVIASRRTRAFLLKSDTEEELIDTLFDARVLHILKRGISSQDQPGIRYDVYGLDYGCYAELRHTQKYPLGLLAADSDSGGTVYIEVPPDDHRAIRRAILDLSAFKNRNPRLEI